jgi:hypothetical protein
VISPLCKPNRNLSEVRSAYPDVRQIACGNVPTRHSSRSSIDKVALRLTADFADMVR